MRVLVAVLVAATLTPAQVHRADAAVGDITTIAGDGSYASRADGYPATEQGVLFATAVAVDGDGRVHFAESGASRIRRIEPDGTVTTVAGTGEWGSSGDGGRATDASLSEVWGMDFDAEGALHFTDTWSGRVRRVGTDGIITTVAGGGFDRWSDGIPATAAILDAPMGVAVDDDGGFYVSDSSANKIRYVASDGTIVTTAGTGSWGFRGDGGPASEAWLAGPMGLTLAPDGSLLVADHHNRRVRRIADGDIATVAGGGSKQGDGGPATEARLEGPVGVATDGAGQLFIADADGYRIRKVDEVGDVSTVAGTGQWGFAGDGGPATSARIGWAMGVAVGGSDLLVADSDNLRIRLVEGIAKTEPDEPPLVPPLPTPEVPDVPSPFQSAPLFGGPVVLAGIDAEDGGVGGHGPIENYIRLVGSVRDDVRNGGAGILVLGGRADDYCTGGFWKAVAAGIGEDVTFAKGADAISAVRLGGNAVIAVTGSWPETCGGLTEEENEALAARRDEIATFVNGGGGLVGFTQVNHTEPYAYVSGLGEFAMGVYGADDIHPTPAGEAVGIDDALDVCCWHNSFLSYPDYLEVLATYHDGSVAALGGARAILCREDGLQTLDGTPGAGAASGTIHDRVEPVVAGIDDGLGEVVHGVNCDFVVPLEDLVDDTVQGN